MERKILQSLDKLDLIEELQAAIGDNDEQKKVSKAIAYSLHAWRDPASLVTGFADLMLPSTRSNGMAGHDSAPRFLLTLAGRPGMVLAWPHVERELLIQGTIATPFLFRAARFAVLGTRLLNEAEEEKGF